MSRFSYEGDGEGFNNQYALWEQAYLRALRGKRGQAALLDLYHALEALPKPRLISSHLAHNGEVCAVGALALYRRSNAGEDPAAVLAELEGLHPATCTCEHTQGLHPGNGLPCQGCVDAAYRREATRDRTVHTYIRDVCTCWDYDEDYQEGGDDWETANVGVAVGTTFTLAWQLGYLNDETYGGCTPEERYTKVKEWVVRNLLPVPVEE